MLSRYDPGGQCCRVISAKLILLNRSLTEYLPTAIYSCRHLLRLLNMHSLGAPFLFLRAVVLSARERVNIDVLSSTIDLG